MALNKGLPRVRSLPTLTPSAEPFIAPHEAEALPLYSYRVKFAVGHVKPKSLPEFAYVTSEVRFDSVVFTAILQAASLDEALGRIKAQWPDAQPREAQEGVRAFHPNDNHLASVQFGATRVEPEIPWYKKLPFIGK